MRPQSPLSVPVDLAIGSGLTVWLGSLAQDLVEALDPCDGYEERR